MEAQTQSGISRPQVGEEDISKGLRDIYDKLLSRLQKKGHGSYASRHEILGILEEEMMEVKEAIRDDRQLGYDEYQKELLDVAVGALFGYICMNSGYIHARVN